MTTREKIREWLAREYFKHEHGYPDKDFPEENWRELCEVDGSNAIVCGEFADKTLTYLHSQGVVIKVDTKELTKPTFGCGMSTIDKAYKQVVWDYAQASMLEVAGCGFFEPLIEEV